MAKKLNSKSQARAKADYEIKPIVTTSADIEANSMLYAVLRLNESVNVKDIRGEHHNVMVTNEVIAGYIPVYKTVEEAKKHTVNGKYQIVAICPA
ncbi:hypothetical protein UFOVP402_41 [uncultured Caudovirales phage]|uniref:Uncharacterized protein n=1 Tax=uncultured Caudovirales phage TaxID=2100421 RepID=A0A6J5M9Z4_9CAUD|nr:hypothetical protein UFOVP402_41 [uncultured Caudovirales phage]